MSRAHPWPSLLVAIMVGGMLTAAADAQPGRPFFHRRPPPPMNNPMAPMLNDPSQIQMHRNMQQRRMMIMLFRQQGLTQMALQQAGLQQAMMASVAGQMSYGYPMMSGGYSSSYVNNNKRLNVPMNVSAPGADTGGNGLLAGLVDANGKIAWPLGLQILRPALETKDLRQRIEGLLRTSAQQAAQGRPAGAVGDELHKAIGQLRAALQQQRAELPERTGQDAATFLQRLERPLANAAGGYGGN